MARGCGPNFAAAPGATGDIRHYLSRSTLLLALLALGAGAAPAWSQEASEDAQVCLIKTEASGGKLGFVVRPAEAARFIRAGFAPVGCPSLHRSVSGIGARCARLRALEDVGRKMIQDMFGLTVDEMCDAHDAWAQSRSDRQ